MKQELIPLDAPTRWKKALDSVPHSFGHTWENCYAMHLTTGYPTFLYQFSTEEGEIVCPIAERIYKGHVDIVTPYGFSGFVGNHDFPDFQNHWKNFVKERGYVSGYIGLNPMLQNYTYFDPKEVIQYNTIYALNLKLTVQELFQKLDRNRRRQLRSYEEMKKAFIVDKALLRDFFLEHFHVFFSQKSAAQVYNFSLETLSYLLNLENVFAVGVFQNHKIEAVSVFAHTPYGADALFNISLPEGKQHNVLLFWYAVNHLKSLGIPYLNIGGGVREGDAIAQSKRRFGAEEFKLSCLKHVYNDSIYSLLCKEANLDPDSKEGYFPVYRSLK